VRRRPILWISIVLLGIFTYDAVLRPLLTGVVALPAVPGGLKVLTAVLALFSLSHSWYSLGGRATAVFFALSAAVSWAYEQAGVATGLIFGAYHYTDYLGGKLGDVPLLIPLAWFMMIYPSYVIANLAVEGRPLGTPGGAEWGAGDGRSASGGRLAPLARPVRLAPLVRLVRLVRLAAASAVVMTLWDLVIDPILSGPSVKAWVWETGGPYFGIPVQNYAGWLLTTFTVYLAFRAFEQSRSGGREAGGPAGAMPGIGRGAAALPVAAYGLMLIADLLSGAAPAQLVAIGPVAMGIPFAIAIWRLALTPRPRPANAAAGEPAAG
jgi:uncharacterized membrane protein